VDKHRVKGILASYSPPLSLSQVDAIAVKIAEVSAKEISELTKTPEAPKSARKSRKSKSQK